MYILVFACVYIFVCVYGICYRFKLFFSKPRIAYSPSLNIDLTQTIIAPQFPHIQHPNTRIAKCHIFMILKLHNTTCSRVFTHSPNMSIVVPCVAPHRNRKAQSVENMENFPIQVLEFGLTNLGDFCLCSVRSCTCAHWTHH